MTAFRYAWSNFVNAGESLELTFERAAACGYDGIELVGEPERYDLAQVARCVESSGVAVSSIGSVFTPERDFASADRAVRRQALEYVKRVSEMAAKLGAPVAIFAPASCMRTSREAAAAEELGWALKGMRAAADHAQSLGVSLALEAWNRYETYWLNRVSEALELAEALGSRNVGVMADVFHMNIEEASIVEAIELAGPRLLHVHLSDSNRSVPGSGQMDFAAILAALRRVGYGGYLTLELIPAAADPMRVLAEGGAAEFGTTFMRQAVERLREVEASLSESEVGV